MTKDDLIEKRDINRAQIQHFSNVLVKNKSKEKTFTIIRKLIQLK